jgi:hypothetical protein
LDRRKCDEGGRPRQRSSPLPRPLADVPTDVVNG